MGGCARPNCKVETGKVIGQVWVVHYAILLFEIAGSGWTAIRKCKEAVQNKATARLDFSCHLLPSILSL